MSSCQFHSAAAFVSLSMRLLIISLIMTMIWMNANTHKHTHTQGERHILFNGKEILQRSGMVRLGAGEGVFFFFFFLNLFSNIL